MMDDLGWWMDVTTAARCEWPCSPFAMSRSLLHTSSAVVASKPEVGSSSSRSMGLWTHSMAMTSLRFSPPLMPP